MFKFLDEIFNKKEIEILKEILDFSLQPNQDLVELQKKIAFSSFYQTKLQSLLLKIKFFYSDFENEFEQWVSKQIHEIPYNYDGDEKLLKTIKDYERELKKTNEYKENKTILDKLNSLIKTLENKDKELNNFDWKVKNIIDIEKIKNGIGY
jgi:hypothetical protein